MIIMLYNNLKALSELKKKEKKVRKLRYKKYGKLKRIRYGDVLSVTPISTLFDLFLRLFLQ